VHKVVDVLDVHQPLGQEQFEQRGKVERRGERPEYAADYDSHEQPAERPDHLPGREAVAHVVDVDARDRRRRVPREAEGECYVARAGVVRDRVRSGDLEQEDAERDPDQEQEPEPEPARDSDALFGMGELDDHDRRGDERDDPGDADEPPERVADQHAGQRPAGW
jgi:hypothetical protein